MKSRTKPRAARRVTQPCTIYDRLAMDQKGETDTTPQSSSIDGSHAAYDEQAISGLLATTKREEQRRCCTASGAPSTGGGNEEGEDAYWSTAVAEISEKITRGGGRGTHRGASLTGGSAFAWRGRLWPAARFPAVSPPLHPSEDAGTARGLPGPALSPGHGLLRHMRPQRGSRHWPPGHEGPPDGAFGGCCTMLFPWRLAHLPLLLRHLGAGDSRGAAAGAAELSASTATAAPRLRDEHSIAVDVVASADFNITSLRDLMLGGSHARRVQSWATCGEFGRLKGALSRTLLSRETESTRF